MDIVSVNLNIVHRFYWKIMGYAIHIIRRENWFEKNSQNDIFLEDWKAYIESDDELSLENSAEGLTGDEQTIKVRGDGMSLWHGHSDSGKVVWFAWLSGKISVNNPDDEIIYKMIKISKNLDAKVQGDEGEIYSADEKGGIVIA